MKNIVFLLMSLMLYGCSGSDKQKTVTEFMVSGDLTAEVVSVPVPYLVPRYMGISGDYLFVYKEREEKLFSLFSLPDFIPRRQQLIRAICCGKDIFYFCLFDVVMH